MDLSIEAIENDLNQAEARAGNPVAAVHLARAQVRATLIAAGYGNPTVVDHKVNLEPIPVAEPEPQVEAIYMGHSYVGTASEVEAMMNAADAGNDEVDSDFFNEARKSRKK